MHYSRDRYMEDMLVQHVMAYYARKKDHYAMLNGSFGTWHQDQRKFQIHLPFVGRSPMVIHMLTAFKNQRNYK
jgi:hypothetical protein